MAGLYQTKSPYESAMQMMQTATGSASAMRPGSKTETEAAKKTVGGALMSGVSTGAAGSAAGSAIASAALGAEYGSAGGWWGAGIGLVGGLLAYYL